MGKHVCDMGKRVMVLAQPWVDLRPMVVIVE